MKVKTIFFDIRGKIDGSMLVCFNSSDKINKKSEMKKDMTSLEHTRYAIPNNLLKYCRNKKVYYSETITFDQLEKFIYMKYNSKQYEPIKWTI